MTADEFSALKSEVEELQRKRARAEGALQAAMQELKSEFDCKDINQAEELLAELEEQERQLEQELRIAERKFRKRWKDAIDTI